MQKKILEHLQELQVFYECIEIDPKYADTGLFCEHYGFPLEQSCNTIIVASKKEPRQYCACVVLATARLDVNRCVKKLMRVSKASFATVEEMKKQTGMEVGGVTVFSLPEGMPLYVDKEIMDLDWIILGGAGRDIKIKTVPVVFEKLGAQIVIDLAIK